MHNAELRTLSEDLVKSFEELEIANFLTAKRGKVRIREAVMSIGPRHRTNGSTSPDFYLPDYGIYIEHFAP